jgi:calcineurin-like phosphoesterase family protein
MIWFTADLHLGHEGILLHQPARLNSFTSVADMDACLISALHAWVRPDDTLYHLGDFCWQASKAGHYRNRLGIREIHFIRGNHDSSSLRKHGSSLNDMLYRRFSIDGERVQIHMTHYPMLSWRGLHAGSIHLYGHSHGRYEEELDKLYPNRRSMDVGVDNIHRLTGQWRPISLDEVLKRLPAHTEDRTPGPWEKA